ncbi:MAG: hypothetical protein RLY87_1793 [Chloroflexota bacterium]|jgi:predicted MFS family arabinose efflux permease
MRTSNTTHTAIAYSLLTLSDGALRMLVMFHCATLGYSALDLAFIFAGYELAGIVTNLYGGRLAARIGVRTTMGIGLALQCAVLCILAATPTFPAIWVLFILQGASGVAKDFTKVGAKSAVAIQTASNHLFRVIALITGAKNTVKGVGFFVGAGLLWAFGAQPTLFVLAALVAVGLGLTIKQPRDETPPRQKATQGIFSPIASINLLSLARIFLFGSRDVWLAIGVPLFFATAPGWGFWQSGAVMAGYTVLYGFIQAFTPRLLQGRQAPGGAATAVVTALPMVVCAGVAGFQTAGILPPWGMVAAIGLYSMTFAIASAIHSYLIAAYAQAADVSKNIGLYYSANALGRFFGVVLSGWCYVEWGIVGCIVGALVFCIPAVVCALPLPRPTGTISVRESHE